MFPQISMSLSVLAHNMKSKKNLKITTYLFKTLLLRNDVIQLVTGDSEEKIQVLPTGVEPMTFSLLVQMLYH